MNDTVRPFNGPGEWLRGNLHGHTTNSDGEYSPAQARRWYADNGYDFLAITDHIHLTPPKADDAPGLIQIPGSEIHIGGHDRPEFHIVALGGDINGLLEHYRYAMQPQEVLDRAAEVGAITFIAHPYRHSLTRAEIAPLTGAIGIEIWNSVSERYGKALSTVVWDELLEVGWRGWGLANDDVHWRNNEQGVGWTMVKAHQRTITGVLEALKAGRFYASTGPAIHDIAIEGREVYVACSPASAVRFMGNRWHCAGVRAQAGREIAEASAKMPEGAQYVRVEVVDAHGKIAWSNPHWFDEA